jgi:hypothetical protein
MESVHHFVTIRVNETSWAHVWRLRSRYLGTGYDKPLPPVLRPNRETVAAGFDAKLGETVTTGIEAKLRKTILVISRPNY